MDIQGLSDELIHFGAAEAVQDLYIQYQQERWAAVFRKGQ